MRAAERPRTAANRHTRACGAISGRLLRARSNPDDENARIRVGGKFDRAVIHVTNALYSPSGYRRRLPQIPTFPKNLLSFFDAALGGLVSLARARTSLARSQMRMDASLMNARELAASLSHRVATRRHCLILLRNRSIKLRARYRYGLKQIGFCDCASVECWPRRLAGGPAPSLRRIRDSRVTLLRRRA
jgi:hypothetical protein